MRKIKQFLLTTAESPQSGRRALSGLFKSKAMKCLLTTLLLLGSTLTSWAVREIYDLPTEHPVLIDESNYQQYGLTSEYIGYLGLSKPQHLYWMTDMGRGRAPINYVLLNDIVMNSGSGTKKKWVPLGGRVYNRVIHSNGTLEVSLNEERAYTGTFDGNGHTISGLYFDNTGSILMITQEESNNYAVSYSFESGPKVGFIGVANGATIKNLGIINATIINDDNYVGGIVGYCINASAENYNGPTTITNCWFEGVVRGKNNTGGICGYGGNITKCYNTGMVSGAYYTGGICGYGGNITNCYNTGAVSGSAYTGGICGNGGTQTNCYTTGMVSSSSSYFGGICGSSGTQNNCYYLEGSCSSRGGGVSATADEFASGKIAYLLNGNTFDGTTWRQTLFTDAAPLLAASHKAVTGYINEVDNVITTYGNVALSTDYTVGEGKTLIIPEGATVTTIGSSKIINNGTLIVEGTISGNNLDGNGAFYYAQLDDADVTLNTVSVPYKGSAYTVGDLDVSYASRIYKGKTFTYSNTATMTYQNNTNCGTATVTWNGSVTREFTIAPKAVTTPTVELSATVFTYSGNEQKPTVTLKDGETVIDPSEYTVTYPSDVVNDGDKTITITDNEGGNYIISECSAEYSIVLDPEIVDGFYQIGNAKQLAWFANLVNSGTTNANAVLVSNIVVNSNVLATDGSLNDDGSNFSVWTPIGTSSRKYTGTFNGQGHTISGLYYNNSTASYVGLFGCADGATITKVGVVDSYLKGNQYVGGICGNGGTIIGCHNASNVSGNSNVGGICGNGGTQTSCYSIGTVSGSAICGNGGTQTLCYYLTGSATSAGGGTNVSETAFTNGEAAYMLNGSTSEGDILWYQDIGADAMPTTNNRHGIVYYSNNLYGNGICPSQIADAAQAEALGLSSSYVGYYAIGSADELYGFSELVKRGTTSANGVLTDDIVVNRNVLNEDGTLNGDGSNFRKWIPIGTSGNSYLGKFNGNGHTVSGLYFDDSEANNVGLFGFLYTNSYDGGSIEDVGVVDSYFNGYQNVGGICGYVLSSNSYGCSIFRCYSTSTISGWRNVGGICGYSSSEINYITHCYNAGSVSGHYDVGGICGGGSYYGKVTVNCCFNVGSVSATNYYDADGICPHAGTRIKCYSLENSAPTLLSSSTIIASASEFASGKIAYLIGEYFRQTLFSDAYPSFNKNSNWVTGYIDEDGDVLTVVGNPVLTTNYTIAEGKTLVIPEGTSYDDRPSIETTGDAVITNNGTIICNGTITGNDLAGNGSFIFENLTSNDVILNTASYPYKGTAYTLEDGLDITISRVMCGKTFTYYNPETPLEVVYYNNVNVGTTASISWRKTFWSEQYSEYNYRQYAYKTFSITPKEVELVWLQSELPYSGEAQAPTATVGNLIGNDVCEVTVEGAQTAVGGPYTATATALSNDNYTLPEDATMEFSILSKTVSNPTIVLSANTFTYNGQAQTPTVTVKDGNTTIDPSEYTVTMPEDAVNAGDKTIAIRNKVGGIYNINSSTTFTIEPKEVTLEWGEYTFTYNGSTQKPEATATGLIGEDVCEVIVSGSQTDQGSYTATAIGLSNGNYKLPEANTKVFTINPREVTLNWSNTSFTYDGSAHVPTATATGLIDEDECNVTVTGAQTNYGSNYTATASGLSNTNYKLPEAATTTFSIAQKEVGLNWGNAEFTYNGSAQAPTATATGLVGNDVCNVTVSGAQTNQGSYTATATGLSNENYKLPENKTKEFSIAQKEVGLAWSNTSLTYNGSAQAPTATATGLVSGDVCSVTVTGAQTNCGTNYTATATGLSNGNYKLPEAVSQAFAIGAKEVSLAWSNTSLIYNGNAQAPTASATGLFGNDVCNVTVSGEQTNVGTYTATATTLDNDNYKLPEAATSEFKINPKEVTLAWGETSFTYNGSAQAPTSTATGLISNDECTVTVEGAATNVGNHTATATGLSNGNYKLSEAASQAFAIGAKEVSLAWSNTSLIYNGNAQAPTASAEGLIENDVCTVTVEGAATNVGNYTATATGLSNGNYKLPEATSQAFAIGAKEVSLAWSNTSLIYNGNAQAPTATAEGLVGNDDCAVTVEGAATNVGNYTATATALDNGNYKLPEAASQAFAIGAKEVSLAWSNTLLIYNGNAQVATATAEGLIGDDVCTVTVSGAQTNAGTHTATATALSNDNYKLPEAASSEFKIEPKEVSLAWSNTSLIYNGAEQIATASAEGIEEGDECTVTVSGEQTNVGTYTATAESLSNSNYKLPEAVTSEFAIAPKTGVVVTITENRSEVVYNTNEQSVEGYTFSINDELSIYAESDFAFSGNAVAKGTTVGKYAMELSAANFENKNENFAEVEFVIVDGELTITKAAEAPNKPEAAMETHYVNTQLVALPENWKWAEYAALVEGDNTATANYDGSDKGNYVVESVAVTIKRLPCLHNEGNELLYTLEPTCTHKGYTGNLSCKLCGEIYEMGDSIPALGHIYDTVAVAATCTTEGCNQLTCSRCGDVTRINIVPANGHKADSVVFENVVAATCTTAGSYDSVTYCTVCNTEISHETIVVAALGHTAGEPVVENFVAPTCTEAGAVDTVVYCTVDNAELNRVHQVIPALGHEAGRKVAENFVASTTTTEGSVDSVVYCTRCKVEISRETFVIPVSDHEHIAGAPVVENFVAPTCTEAGSVDTAVYCTVNGELLSLKTTVLPALGHKADSVVKENVVNATFEAAGSYELVTYCSVCGAEISREKVEVPQLVKPVEAEVVEIVISKLEYTVGDSLKLDGGKIVIATSDSTTAEVAITSEMISGFNSDSVGVQTVTVAFEIDGVAYTTTFDVEVKEAEVIEVVAKSVALSAPVKITYKKGEALDVAGGKLTVTYSDGTTQDVELKADMVSGFDADKVGAQQLTVTLTVDKEVLTASFDVTVEADDDTAISDDEAAAVNIYAYQNVIVVESADAHESEISIFDVNGRMVAKELAAGSRTEIMMQQQGIYIVKVNNTAKRVMVY